MPAMIAAELAPSKSQARRCYSWTDCIAPDLPGDGVLSIRCGKVIQVYLVAEVYSPGPDGRTFVLVKTGESMKAKDSPASVGVFIDSEYETFVGKRADVNHCTCSGFGRWKGCKHADALRALIEAGHIPDPRRHPSI